MQTGLETAQVVEAEGLRLDCAQQVAIRGGQQLPLGRDEFSAMELFVAARGRIVPFATLSRTLWPDRDLEMHNVRNVLYRLRRKLRGSHSFEAIVGEGYRLVKRC